MKVTAVFHIYSTYFKIDKLMQVFYIQIPSAKITIKDTFEQQYSVVKINGANDTTTVLTVIQLFEQTHHTMELPIDYFDRKVLAVTKRNTQYLSKLNSLSPKFSVYCWKFTEIILRAGGGEKGRGQFQVSELLFTFRAVSQNPLLIHSPIKAP